MRIEDTRLPKCVIDVWRSGEGRGLRGGAGKRVNGVFPGLSQSFRHQRRSVNACSPGREGMSQDGGTGGGTFHGEMGRRRESQGWTTACSSKPVGDGRAKERIARSKRARPGLPALVD